MRLPDANVAARYAALEGGQTGRLPDAAGRSLCPPKPSDQLWCFLTENSRRIISLLRSLMRWGLACVRSKREQIQLIFAEHHDMVEALASDRSDQPFNMTILPW